LLVIEIVPGKVPTLFDALPPSCVFDKNAPHCLGSRRKEVSAIGELLNLGGIDQPQIRLMHEGRAIERLTRFLTCHLLVRQPAQLIIHQGQQLLCRLRLPRLNRAEDLREFVHADRGVALGPSILKANEERSLLYAMLT